MSHPNLNHQINKALEKAEGADSIDLRLIPVGSELVFKTRNSWYTCKRVEGGWSVTGGKYFPKATLCSIPGSTFGGSMLKLDTIFVGGYVEFHPKEGDHKGKTITTSHVVRFAY